jgi:hypothetical protein
VLACCALQWLVDLEGKTAAKIPSAHEEGSRLYFGNLAGEASGHYKVTRPTCFQNSLIRQQRIRLSCGFDDNCAYRGAPAEQA